MTETDTSTPYGPELVSGARTALAISRDICIIVAAIVLALWADQLWLSIVAVIVVGCLQFSLGEVLLHESAHGNLVRSERFNRPLQVLLAWPFFRTVDSYRGWHFPHHRYRGSELDPLFESYSRFQAQLSRRHLFRVWWVEPFAGPAQLRFFRQELVGAPRRDLVAGLTFNIALMLTCWAAGIGTVFLAYWLLPFLLVFPALYHWQEFEDHFGCAGIGRVSTGRLRSFLQHDSGYHGVHHVFPNAPFHQLRTLLPRCDIPAPDISTSLFCTWTQIDRQIVEREQTGSTA